MKHIHPVVLAVIINDDSQVLLTKRAVVDGEDPKHFLNKWEIPGGGMDFGENPEESVRREAREELGIEIADVEFLPITFTKVRKYWQGLFLIFKARMKSQTDEISLNEESSDYKWLSLAEVQQAETLPGVKEVVEYVLKNKKTYYANIFQKD